ncbi:GNAT family N-acetyltransferase [bacterium]|nr:GNAT family N-acetyltransferase [bacterium]
MKQAALSSPYFNTWTYLKILNNSGCINQHEDWLLYGLVVKNNQYTIIKLRNPVKNQVKLEQYEAVLPFFIRYYSNDDFSHDNFCIKYVQEHIKTSYYPKVQVCLPYVPIAEDKFIQRNKTLSVNKVYESLLLWAEQKKYSSVHVTLPSKKDYETLKSLGFFSSKKQLCYWYNKNYQAFEGFLAALKSKYRCQIKKERSHIHQKGYQKQTLTGDTIKKLHIDCFWHLFKLTHHRKQWIMSKLNKNFFYEAWQRCPENIVLHFLTKDQETVAVSWAFLHKNILCGRFWGSLYDKDYIHFEVMYYMLIDYAIKHKVNSIEMGFANLHKVIRGFEPELKYNFHYFFNHQLNNSSHYSLPDQKNYKRIYL